MTQNERFSRRRFLSVFLTSAGAAGATALLRPRYAQAEGNAGGTSVFVDDLGRSVRIPRVIGSVTPTGINGQTMLCELCPDKLASLAVEIGAEDVTDYEQADMGGLTELPETGTLLSTTDVDLDSDDLVEASPTVMVDVGLPKEGLAERLNALQLETNIPYIFIDISFGNLPKAYRTLGSLLGCGQRAEILASYVESVMSEVQGIANGQETDCKVFYAHRERGLSVTGGLSLQLDAISHAGGTPVSEPYDHATGKVDLDVLAKTGPDWIVFDDTEVLEPFLQGEGEIWHIWSDVVLSSGSGFAVSPALYHSWLGSMIYVQSLGLLWLAKIMWPASCPYDMDERAREFYDLFYGFDLAEDTTRELVGELPEEVLGDER